LTLLLVSWSSRAKNLCFCFFSLIVE
jgi:hypothetical protein